MRLMLNLIRAYPMASFLMLLALFLSAFAEGLGVSALLPMLKVALYPGGTGAPDEPPSEAEQIVLAVLDWLGIPATLGPLLAFIVAAAALKGVLLLLAHRQVGYTAAQIATDLRLEVLRNMMRSRWRFFLHQPTGKLTNTMATEAQRASEAYINGSIAITYLIQSMIYAAVAVAVSWEAALASVGGGIVILGATHFLVRKTRRAGKKQTQFMTSLMARMTDTLQSVKPLKAMAREELADQVLELETKRLNKSLRRQVFAGAALNSGQDLLFTMLIALGIYLALAQFSMGLATVTILVLTLGRAFNFLGKVQKQQQKVAQGESAYWSLMETIEKARSEEERFTGRTTPALREGIIFDKVDFGYDGHPIFAGLNLSFPARKMTTLVGPSGTGKTTIIDLIIGLLQPDGGQVLVGGDALTDLDITAWRKMIGYVPQETVLLNDSVVQNVTLGDPAISEEQVVDALKEAEALEFMNELPEGMDTIVGERGGRLSGGQRQRIAIARALVNRPQLLILDEATSALDPDSEAAIVRTLGKLKDHLTIVTISHNLALADAADHVYRLERGGQVQAVA